MPEERRRLVCAETSAKLNLFEIAVRKGLLGFAGLYTNYLSYPNGVITNLPDMDSAEVLSHYHGLWQVEETFRISKHDLRVRPIYHWTPAQVHRHPKGYLWLVNR